MPSTSKKKSTTKKTDMKKTLDEQHRQEGRHYPVIPHKVPNVETQQVRKPQPTQIRRTEERMKEHIERVLETLKNKSEFLQLELQEKVEQIDEISLKTMKSAKEKLADKAVEYHYDDNKHYARAYASRALNMGNKIRKKEMAMKKEEVEQIDELSKKTLGNYVAKAVVDVHNDARWAGETDDKDAKNKAFKRLLGVKSAAARLSKQNVSGGRISNFRRNNEEVEQIDEVDMGQAERGMRTSTTHTGGYHVIHSKSGKVVSKHKSQFDAMRALNRIGDDDHELKAVHESTDKERPYVVVHAKKGLHKTTAKTSYEAAQKAASHWKLKSTAGIDAHPADSDRFMHEGTISSSDYKLDKSGRKYPAHRIKTDKEEVELDEGNKENKQKLRTVDRTVGQNWNKLDLHKTLAPTSPLRMGRAVRRFAKSDTYKALSKGDKVDEAVQIDEDADSGLAAKAEKSGVSLGTLRKVYKRGVAAWNSGHRPGTTPQQWGMARVNSYITKGKGTYHGADKDLREEADPVATLASSLRDPSSYDAIDQMMQTIAKESDISPKELHNSFVKKYGKTPDEYAKGMTEAAVPKDPHSGLPKKYVSGLSPSTAKARASHWKEKSKLSDRDPAAYEPAPGDATAKTKESKHTKKYRQMYGEACWSGYKKVGMKKKGDKMVPDCVSTNEAVHDATTPTQAQATVGGRMKSLAQSIKSKKKGKDDFDANPEFVSQVQPNASNY